jgi:hypothetical protein
MFLGARRFYSEHARAIPLFVLGPVAVYMLAFAFSRRLRAWALAFDPKELVAIQMARVGGFALPCTPSASSIQSLHSGPEALTA